jgi:hypothetical protein
MVVVLSAFTTMRAAQPDEAPTTGHWVNGDRGEAAKTILGSSDVIPTQTKKRVEMIFLIFSSLLCGRSMMTLSMSSQSEIMYFRDMSMSSRRPLRSQPYVQIKTSRVLESRVPSLLEPFKASIERRWPRSPEEKRDKLRRQLHFCSHLAKDYL